MAYHRFSTERIPQTQTNALPYHRFVGTIAVQSEDTDYNKGGIGGGIKYVGGKALAGGLGVLEGIWDFTAGGISSAFGNDEYAKRLMDNDVSGDMNQSLDEEYNPSKAMRFAGDVAGGIGQSSVGIAASAGIGALVVASGGTLAPAAAALIAGGTIGLGAAGKATTEAYKKTGELGLKEYGYGATSGAIEAALETVTGGAGKIAKKIATPYAKNIAKTAVRQGIVRTMFSAGAGEFVEEAISEAVDPYLQRGYGIDKEAENATMQEIIYAGMVGFASGALMGGTQSATSNARNARRGTKILAENKQGNVLEKANELRKYTLEAENSDLVAEPLKALNMSLDAYDKAKKGTTRHTMLLGEVSQTLAYLETSIGVQASKSNVLKNAEILAKVLQQQGQEVTAEDIMANKGDIANKLAIHDFVGKMLIPEDQYTALVRQGQMVESQSNYIKWQESIDQETKTEISQMLNLDLNTATYEDMQMAMRDRSAVVDKENARQASDKAIKELQRVGELVNANLQQGVEQGATARRTPLELPDKIGLKPNEEQSFTTNGITIDVKNVDGKYIARATDQEGNSLGGTKAPITEAQLQQVVAEIKQPDYIGKVRTIQTNKKKPIKKEDTAKKEAEQKAEEQKKQEEAKAEEQKVEKESTKSIDKNDERLKKDIIKYLSQKGLRENLQKVQVNENSKSILDGYSAVIFYGEEKALDGIPQNTTNPFNTESLLEPNKEINAIKEDILIWQKAEQLVRAKSVSVKFLGRVFNPKLIQQIKTLLQVDRIGKKNISLRENPKTGITSVYVYNNEGKVDRVGIILPLRIETVSKEIIELNNAIINEDIEAQERIKTKRLEEKEADQKMRAKEVIEKAKARQESKAEAERNKLTPEQIKAKRQELIKKAQEKKREDTLSRKFTYTIDGKKQVLTRKEFIEKSINEQGYTPESVTVKDYKEIDRLKERLNDWLKPSERERIKTQIERLQNGENSKFEYRLLEKERKNVFYQVTKAEYDYAKQLYDAQAVKTEVAKAEQEAEKKELAKRETEAKEKKELAEKKTKQETDKLQDFGEKIGGARKDVWSKRGLEGQDLDVFNDAEIDKHVKKDNVWKKPDYTAMIENGKPSWVAYKINEIRKAISPKPEYFYKLPNTVEARKEQAKLYVDTIREIQALVEGFNTESDLRKLESWMKDNGYITMDATGIRAYPKLTEKGHNNPAIYGSSTALWSEAVSNLEESNLKYAAQKAQFGVKADEKVPKGYNIAQEVDYDAKQMKNVYSDKWWITKSTGWGNQIIAKGFESREAALKQLKDSLGKKDTKYKFVPPQLENIHRTGREYRKADKAITGEDFMATFGVKGGEFGNWLNETDRQVNINYAYDAFADLAEALGVENKDMSFNGKLNFAWGARGVSSAAAHYETARQVINLTKLKGAGTLGHEWAHALDHYLNGFSKDGTLTQALGKYGKNKTSPKIKEAVKDIVDKMKYTEKVYTEQEKTEMFDRRVKDWETGFEKEIEYYGSIKKEMTAQQKAERQKIIADLKKAGTETDFVKRAEQAKLLIDKLSDLRKTVDGRVIGKENRTQLFNRVAHWNPKPVTAKKEKSNFLIGSALLGEYSSHSVDYWTSDIEMFARAFHTYVLDKATEKGVRNDYLNGFAEVATIPGDITGKTSLKGKTLAAFPVGEERKTINRAFDNLFNVLREEGVISERQAKQPDSFIKYSIADETGRSNENKITPSERIKSKSADAKARRFVKNYDLLPVSTRGRIQEAIISGKQFNIDDKTINAVSNIMAVRDIAISFSNIDHNGIYTTREGQRIAVINPSSNIVKQTILHELTHDLEGTQGYEEISRLAMANVSATKKNKIQEQYENYYKEIGKEIDQETIESEIVADYVAEKLGNEKFLGQYVNENLSFFQKAKKWLADIKSKLTGSIPAYAEVRKLELLYKNLVEGQAEAVAENTKYSLAASNGKELTEAQTEFFKDSKVRDEQGRLLEVYHGTNAEFTVFDENKIGQNYYQSEGGFFFTNRKRSAENYAELHYLGQKDGQAKVINAYLNIKKPYIVSVPSAWQGAEFFDDHRSEILREAELQGADGIIAESKFGSLYIAFNPNQIKLTTNLNPTANEDIRYSLTEPHTVQGTDTNVLTTMPQSYKVTKREAIKDGALAAQIQFVNAQAGIEKVGKQLGIKNIEELTNSARAGQRKGEEMLGGSQFTLDGKEVGKGLEPILRPIEKKGGEYKGAFFEYLLHRHNVHRLLQDKAIFGKEVTPEVSEKRFKELEKQYPEFLDISAELYKYQENLMQLRVDSGLISQETADELHKRYPNYVPTFRDVKALIGTGALSGKYNMAVKPTIKTAKGSDLDILPIDIMIAKQTLETTKAAGINRLAVAIYKGAQDKNDFSNIEIRSEEKVNSEEMADIDYAETRPTNNEVTFFYEGKRITMRVSKGVFAGFEAFSPSVELSNPFIKAAQKINNIFKRLVTAYNPAFLLRNAARDLQDAGMYSRYIKSFPKNYARAINEIKSNGALWRQYKGAGGLSSSIFNLDDGFNGAQNKHGLTKAEGNLLKKGLQTLENANMFIEQLPRLAEFISSIEAGNTVDKALLDAQDITVNFGRSGTLTKKLNSTLIPFLNPAIQGFSKMIRTVTSARTARQISGLLVKVAIMGIIPQLLNQLMYDDDEDYALLNDRDKENYYLFKIGKKFLKIPKGRVNSLFAGLTMRAGQISKGEKADWKGYGANLLSQVTPVDSMSRTIFSPFKDLATNTTWYGSAIEGRKFENVEPKKRYDEGTSSIAIAMGKFLNYSPKKIHYLLDQYSGVIGDFILPATTKKAEKGFISGNFTVDPTTQNKLANSFYHALDKANFAKSNNEENAEYQVRYLNKVNSAISDMYKQKREIEGSDLSDKEKMAESKAIQILINEAYKTALQDLPLMKEAISATSGLDEDIRYTEATRLVYGAERALRDYNKQTYEKAQTLNLGGINYDTFYQSYFTIKNIESDKDRKGVVVSGSKKVKVIKYVNTLNLSRVQKALLILSSGYTIQDGEIRGSTAKDIKRLVASYISRLGISREEKIALAEQCGLTIKNGRVVIN